METDPVLSAGPSLEEVSRLRAQLAEAQATILALTTQQRDAAQFDGTGPPVLLAESQRALRLSEERYRLIVETAAEGIWLTDARPRITFANRQLAKMLGYATEDMIDHDVSDFLFAEDQPALSQRWEQRHRCAPEEFEQRFRRRDGTELWARVSASPLTNAERVFIGALGMFSDLTDRRATEARVLAADRLMSIGMLAAGVAHEINNPLAYVMANLDYLADRIPPALGGAGDDPVQVLAEAKEGTQRILQIVRDLKIFSRPDCAAFERVNLHSLLDSISKMAWNEIRHRARLIKDYARESLGVDGHESRLGQVFLNLLVNAAQAIPEGAASENQIRITTGRRPDGRVSIEVGDTGLGISPEVQRRLFTPFFTTKPKGIGTGLGLSICQNIVACHRGTIEVESEPGRGATFRVLLPAPQAQVAELPRAPERTPPQRPARVLVVEYDPLVATALRRILGSLHEVEVASDGRQALEILSTRTTFDVIFCDVMMPQISVMELYKGIEGLLPELARRIVFVSGGVFSAEAQAFLQTVPNPRLEKPFDRNRILAIVNATANGRLGGG